MNQQHKIRKPTRTVTSRGVISEACSTNRREVSLVHEAEWKIPLGIARPRKEDSIKMDLKKYSFRL
jgi:hypothetical protein